jgi:hypothetical protein
VELFISRSSNDILEFQGSFPIEEFYRRDGYDRL